MSDAKLIEPGTRFGYLTVLSRGPNDIHKKGCFMCRCVCGVEKLIAGWELRRGDHSSCGCRRARNFRSVMLKSEPRRWREMFPQPESLRPENLPKRPPGRTQ